MNTTIEDVKRYLWLHGSGNEIALDPVELLRELLDEYVKLEKLAGLHKQRPSATR